MSCWRKFDSEDGTPPNTDLRATSDEVASGEPFAVGHHTVRVLSNPLPDLRHGEAIAPMVPAPFHSMDKDQVCFGGQSSF